MKGWLLAGGLAAHRAPARCGGPGQVGEGVGFGVGDGVGEGVGVGGGDDVGTAITVMVTLTVDGVAVTPAMEARCTVNVRLPARPPRGMESVGMESKVLSRSWGPASTTVS